MIKCELGVLLKKRLMSAIKEYNRQLEGWTSFTQGQKENVSLWKKQVEEYEAGQSTENPYSLPVSGEHRANVVSSHTLMMARYHSAVCSIGAGKGGRREGCWRFTSCLRHKCRRVSVFCIRGRAQPVSKYPLLL